MANFERVVFRVSLQGMIKCLVSACFAMNVLYENVSTTCCYVCCQVTYWYSCLVKRTLK